MGIMPGGPLVVCPFVQCGGKPQTLHHELLGRTLNEWGEPLDYGVGFRV